MTENLSRSSNGWTRVNGKTPCPVCGKLKGCLISADQNHAVCLRDGSGSPVSWGLGGSLHQLKPGSVPIQPAFIPIGSQRKAQPDLCDRVYQHLLGGQQLSSDHRSHLQEIRQLSTEAITARGYASWGSQPRAPLARSAFDLFGAVALDVPGVIVRQQKREYLTLAGSPGLAIPIRNVKSRIVAVQIRPDKPRPGQGKYNGLSSASRGGASPGTPIHVARPRGDKRKGTGRVWLTEGPLKADIACERLDEIVLAVLGVRALKELVPTLKELRRRGELRELVIALDSDWHTKDDVQEARHLAAERAARAGVPIWLADWTQDLKGLDDLLLAGKKPKLQPYRVQGNGPRPVEDADPELIKAQAVKPTTLTLDKARDLQKKGIAKFLAANHRGNVGLLVRSLPGMGKSHALTECLNDHPERSIVFIPRHELSQGENRENWGSVRGRTHQSDELRTPCAHPDLQIQLSVKRIAGQLGCENCPALELCTTNPSQSEGPYYHAQFDQKRKVTTHPIAHFHLPGPLKKVTTVAFDDCDFRSLSLEQIHLSRPRLEHALDWAQRHQNHAYGNAQPLLSLLVRLLQDVPAGTFKWQEVELFEQLEQLSTDFLKQSLVDVLKKADLAEEPDPFAGKSLLQTNLDVPVRFIKEIIKVLSWEYEQYQSRHEREWDGWNCRIRIERPYSGQDVELRLTLRRDLPTKELQDKRVIIIDASLSVEEAQRLFPGIKWNVLDPYVEMPHTVKILQYPDQGWGKMRLQSPKARKQALEIIRRVIQKHPGESISIITHKSFGAEVKKAYPQLLVGNFFGQRGSNQFENCDVQIVFGTPNPNPDQLQEQAESLYWDQTPVLRQTSLEPMVFETEPGRPARQVSVRSYTDPRLAELHRSKCVDELIQAIYRVRPLSVDSNPKYPLLHETRQQATVYLFSSMPLPGLKVQLIETGKTPADVTPIHQAALAITHSDERITQKRLADQAQISLYRSRCFLTSEPAQTLTGTLGAPPAQAPPLQLAGVN